MAKIILTHDGTVIKEYLLEKERMTIGRKPHNDIQLDDNTVSGEHAAFLALQNIYIEDLGSTNGTLLNGERVKKRMLNHNDIIKIGRHEFKFLDNVVQDFENTVVIPSAISKDTNLNKGKHRDAFVEVIDGAKSGDIIQLNKAYTTLGSPGVSVVVIARRGQSYYIMPMGGTAANQIPPSLNNSPITSQSQALTADDVIEVAGSKLKFNYK
ncbi:MAG: FHA domain-containing protein [Gammaproteobacteria bacterium]